MIAAENLVEIEASQDEQPIFLWPIAAQDQFEKNRRDTWGIEVWSASLSGSRGQLRQCEALLSADERERAARFHFPIHRERFIFGRAILRTLLSAFADTPAEKLSFSYTESGKPFLNGPKVFFNLAHCEDVAVYAISSTEQVGIDVERVRELNDQSAVARISFSPGEYQRFALLREELKPEGFFNCWTRKEAFVKAIGSGISNHLQNFCVQFEPGHEARFLRINIAGEELSDWSIREFEPAIGFLGALAWKGPVEEIEFSHFQFSEVL